MTDIARRRATDPSLSYLVQAPAGSGKTELLTRRILALLAVVDEPEEILALTFTRKAAAEMGNRVIDALGMEKPGEDKAHKLETWKLAQKALERSDERGWNLAGHPARLRIMTLDSLTGMLARQLPLLSGLGDVPVPGEHSAAACRKAAEKTLRGSMRDDSKAVEALLLHQDHNSIEVIRLMVQMLESRDQWLKYIAEHGRDTDRLRRNIEENLATYLNAQLRDCDAMVPVAFKSELVTLIRYAGLNLKNEEMQSFDKWPACDLSGLTRWKQLALFLLTGNEARFRKSVDKRNGFPPDGKEQKAAFLSLLEELASVPGLAETLHSMRSLPDSARFEEPQWQLAEALFELLPLAVHNLKAIHASEGRSDYTEIAMRALEALNDAEGNPSDLLLRLDYRISHILIDEFQDTSELQINLLQRLTAGWQPDDGRTLFMVGDPMQSIYRFRKAEVGFFLLAAKNMAGLPPVETLSLERNFRSSPVIVDWVNRAFRVIFPKHEDPASGAIAHVDAVPHWSTAGTVKLYQQRESAEVKADDAFEAAHVVELVRQALKSDSSRIGILARTRKHLHAIIPALQEAEIPHRAIKILPLQTRPEIRTMRALLRALLHPADDESWLSLLRAPCCGLDTKNLFELMHGDDRCLAQILFDDAARRRMDDDSRSRAEYLASALAPCLQISGAGSLRHLLSVAWERLNMPALTDATAAINVETLLDLIDEMDESGRIDFALFDERIGLLFAAPDVSEAAARVELLTMHGAKGLQWDVVILPGTGKPPKNSDSPLLAFTEAPVDGKGLFLMSPKAETRNRDPLFDLVRSIEKRKEQHELARLLYVAATRAESELHLLGHVTKDDKAAKGSFLELLLQQDDCFGAEIADIEMKADTGAQQRLPLQRITTVPTPLTIPERRLNNIPEYGWAGAEAAPIGIALHAVLQRIGDTGIEKWEGPNADDQAQLMTRILISEGLSGKLLEKALERCRQALEKTLASKMGRWILSGNHQDAHCEWEIWSEADGYLQQRFIDRSFIDDHDVRWIIDYKTGSHEGANLNAFLDNEAERYADQLSGYRRLLHELEPEREIRTALYFPAFDGWREIKVDSPGPL